MTREEKAALAFIVIGAAAVSTAVLSLFGHHLALAAPAIAAGGRSKSTFVTGKDRA